MEESAVAEDEIYLAPINQLISANDDALPALTAEILAQGKVLLAPNRSRWLPMRPCRWTALGRAAGAASSVTEITKRCLGRVGRLADTSRCALVADALLPKIGKVGGLINDALITIAKDTEYNTYAQRCRRGTFRGWRQYAGI
ncbi:MAG: hypothetical protein R2932_23035 [Caldilineaceae bacterium]